MKLTAKILLMLFCAFQISCKGDSEERRNNHVDSFSYEDINFKSLIEDLNELDQAITLEQVLQNNVENSKIKMIAAIENARVGALTIAKYGNEDPKRLEEAYSALSSAIGSYDSFKSLEFEQSRFDKVFNRVKELRFILARRLGRSDNYTWVLYNHNFADGIEPYFNSFPGLDSRKDLVKWVTNFQTGIPKAKVQGREAYSWIVSKPFSLNNIQNPTFRYFTQFTVVAPNPKYSLNDVVDKVFKTYIILNQLPGENPESMKELFLCSEQAEGDTRPCENLEDVRGSRKKRVRYEVDELPLARDFHDAWMPSVSLEPYKAHKVSIAFLFDTRPLSEKQYYIWDIFDVEIQGAGVMTTPASIYAANFKDELGSFNSVSLNFGGENWKKKEDPNNKDRYSGVTKSAEIKSGNSDTETFLLSPLFNISTDTELYRLVLNDTLSGADMGTAEVLISTNYSGGIDPFTEGVKWDTLLAYTEVFEKKQTVLNLSKYIGESVVLAFRFKSEAKKDFTWTIDSMYLETEGEDLTEVVYTVPDLEAKFILASQDLLENYKSFKKIYLDEETSPKWKKATHGVSISGYGKPIKEGESQILFPEMDLSTSLTNKIRINYNMQHVKDRAIVKFSIRASCLNTEECVNDWEELRFPNGTFTKRLDNLVNSSWVDVPEKFNGGRIEVMVSYKAIAKPINAPGFQIRRLELGGVTQ